VGRGASESGEPRSLLRYYHGRSTLATWVRAVLAQRHVDQIREARRVMPTEQRALPPTAPSEPDPGHGLSPARSPSPPDPGGAQTSPEAEGLTSSETRALLARAVDEWPFDATAELQAAADDTS
jgi:DNA-directed RNA polymerase specialized sigma24 family protein